VDPAPDSQSADVEMDSPQWVDESVDEGNTPPVDAAADFQSADAAADFRSVAEAADTNY